jgi:hypothetical protein
VFSCHFVLTKAHYRQLPVLLLVGYAAPQMGTGGVVVRSRLPSLDIIAENGDHMRP